MINLEYVNNHLEHIQRRFGLEPQNKWSPLDSTIPAERAELVRRIRIAESCLDPSGYGDEIVRNLKTCMGI